MRTQRAQALVFRCQMVRGGRKSCWSGPLKLAGSLATGAEVTMVALESAIGATLDAIAGAVRQAMPIMQPSMSCCSRGWFLSPPSSGQQSCADAAGSTAIGHANELAEASPLAARAKAVSSVNRT